MWQHLLLVLVLVIGLEANNIDEDYDDRDLGVILNDNIKIKCSKLGNDKKEMLKHAESEFESCYRRSTSRSLKPEEEQLKEMISFLCAEDCRGNFLKKVKVCLSPEEEFLLELSSSTKELCKDNRKILKEKLEGYLDAECPGSPHIMVWYAIYVICTPKLIFMHHKSEPDFVFKLSDICSDLKTFHSCALDVVPQSCASDDLTKYVSVLYEPYVEWCDKNMLENDIE